MTNVGKNSVGGTSGLFNKIRIRDLGKQVEARAVGRPAADRRGELGELRESELLFVAGGRIAAGGRITYAGGAPSDCG